MEEKMDEGIKKKILNETDWEKAEALTVGLKYLDNEVIEHLGSLLNQGSVGEDNYYIRKEK